MKSFLRKLTTLSAIAVTSGAAVMLPSSADAAQFGQQPIANDRVVAIAEPISNGRFYKLLIIEQISSSRQCWQEQVGNPTTISPLLLTFDFTGICGRSSDSNGYSVRIGGEDLGSRYRLQVEKRGDTLVLVASPSPLQRGLPKLELGRSNGVANDFVKIELDAGWTMARRVYNGQTLGHIYLSNSQPLDAVIASSGASPVTTAPRPTTPSPLPTPPSGSPSLPRPGSGSPLPSPNSDVDYQVIVPGSSAVLRSRVNAVEPGAFRTTVNGQAVIQAGRFREQSRANELRQRLTQAGLSAQIVETGRVSTPVRPTPSPSGDVVYQVIVPGSSNILRSRVNAVESGSFRTTVNGQAVIQAGRFREQRRAADLQRRLQDVGLDAQVVQTTGTVASPSPSTSPTTPARRGEVLVMIDPGHGGRDPGAVGNGLQEKEINLFISRRLQRTLEQRGYRVALTRNSDFELDLQPRVDIAERANATIFVSIHANAISLSRPEVNGLETYYFSSGRNLARSIHSSVLRSTDLRDRGVRQARFYVLRNTSMPAVLVETGFITGREDSARLRSNAAREQIADAIAQGIIDYLR
ncbi:MAG: DUF3747 domain-containing protein [Leptolyngbya sp. SIO3F4]|nr:DUF3747 domain-containing protein [Leptolyngbya sp. SIO3F4]